MRNISFALTTMQFKNRTKTVTRRLGWKTIGPGETLQAVVKSQGLKKGEHPVKLGKIYVESVRREKLKDLRTRFGGYGRDECKKEGFPEMLPWEFIMFFCKHNKCDPETFVTRIEFSYLD
jgi:hypothetical protein